MRIFAIKQKKIRNKKIICGQDLMVQGSYVTVVDFKYGDVTALRLIFVRFSR